MKQRTWIRTSLVAGFVAAIGTATIPSVQAHGTDIKHFDHSHLKHCDVHGRFPYKNPQLCG